MFHLCYHGNVNSFYLKALNENIRENVHSKLILNGWVDDELMMDGWVDVWIDGWRKKLGIVLG